VGLGGRGVNKGNGAARRSVICLFEAWEGVDGGCLRGGVRGWEKDGSLGQWGGRLEKRLAKFLGLHRREIAKEKIVSGCSKGCRATCGCELGASGQRRREKPGVEMAP